jgi:hypothetical protein
MPGLLDVVAVKPGQKVQAGERVAVIEAMKMENVLFAAADGVVGKVLASKGESLAVVSLSAAPTSCGWRACGWTCAGWRSPAPSRAIARTSTRTSAPENKSAFMLRP